MNGFESTSKIKELVLKKNYIDPIIISYSCNVGLQFEEKC